jgi:hypothetical protein
MVGSISDSTGTDEGWDVWDVPFDDPHLKEEAKDFRDDPTDEALNHQERNKY